MAKKDEDLPRLGPGAEVVLILDEVSGTRSKSGDRRTVIGVGRGLVTEARSDGTYKVKLTMASKDYMIGREVEKKRGGLYWVESRSERRGFDEIVRLFWGRKKP